MRTLTLLFVFALFSSARLAVVAPNPPIPDCTPLVDFLEDELMALTHTAVLVRRDD